MGRGVENKKGWGGELRIKRDGEGELRMKRDGGELRIKMDGEGELRIKRDGEGELRMKRDGEGRMERGVVIKNVGQGSDNDIGKEKCRKKAKGGHKKVSGCKNKEGGLLRGGAVKESRRRRVKVKEIRT